MAKSRTLLTYHDLAVEVETSPGEELIQHMHDTVMGQPGGLRYQHTNLVDRLNTPGENYFMYLRKSGKMMGSVGFCGKQAETDGFQYDSWMIRYFSIKAPMRVVPKKRKEKTDLKDENKRTSVLGRFIQPVFANPSQLREDKKDGDRATPSIIYAMIEQNNLRSMNFSTQMGLETVGELASFTFSRMRPRESRRMEQITVKDHSSMLALLKDFYTNYTLYFPDPLFKNNDYYIIKESGRIVAGVQVYQVTWRIIDFGDWFSNTIVRLLTRFKWFKKRINPDEVRFLAFDGIYCEQGYESTLYELMEGVLANTGTYLGMLMMDSDSHLFRIFEERRKLGVLHRILGTFNADIRMRFINMPENIRSAFLNNPTYVPTYDNS